MSVNLYRVELTNQIGSDGLGHWWSVGTPITVDDTPMVRLSHGAIVPAATWRATIREAANLAADKVEAMGKQLLEQAAVLRQATEAKP